MLSFTQRLLALGRGVLPLDLLVSPVPRADLLVFGLGNPGAGYRTSRHNAGILAAASLQERAGGTPFRRYRDSLVSTLCLDGRTVLVALPRVPMNGNGRPLARLAAAAGVGADRVLVLHDDLGLEPGRVRIAGDGDSRIHGGLRSVAVALGTPAFTRIRIGIGQSDRTRDLAYLLDGLEGAELEALAGSAGLGAEAARLVAQHGLVRARAQVNRRSWAAAAGNEAPRVPAPVLVPTVMTLLLALLGWAGRELLASSNRWLFAFLGLWRRTVTRGVRQVVVIGSYGKTTTQRTVSAALGLGPSWRFPARGVNSLHFLAVIGLAVPPWRRHAVIEAGISEKGRMARYGWALCPDVVVWTGLGSEHQGSFASLEEKRDEKARMVEALRPGGVLVINGDDPRLTGVAERYQARGRVVRVGLGPWNEVRASALEVDFPTGTRFKLHLGKEVREVRIPLLGEAMVRSALAALAVAEVEGVAPGTALARLERVEGAPCRLRPVALPGGAWLVRDEYKAAVETVDAALDLLEAIPDRRKLVVLGDIEEPPRPAHQEYIRIGKRLGRIAARVVVLGTAFDRYRVGTRQAGMPDEHLFEAGKDLGAALGYLASRIEPGDLVLVKGRSTDHHQRLSLALLGREVRCSRDPCPFFQASCDLCHLLALGPTDLRPPDRDG